MHNIEYKRLIGGYNMSDLTTASCGCGNNKNQGSNGIDSMFLIIILLCCSGGGSNGLLGGLCGNNECGSDNGLGGILPIILLLCLCGGGGGIF
ncbi:MAG: hypothetical protein K0S01_2498 [Herbinix sp.]|jgi:hypothetical protein|nr:hypothetical protein [Herbinix sp.]